MGLIHFGQRFTRFAAAGLILVGAALAAPAPALAKTMIYVPESYGEIGAWYVVLSSDGKARLVGNAGAKSGTFTDNGTEVLVTLKQPLSFQATTGPDQLDCTNQQYLQRYDVQKVLFRRVDGTNVNKGKSRVIQMGTTTDIGGCTPGLVTSFGSLADAGAPALHRNAGNREPMTDVVAGLTIAGMREPPRPDPFTSPYASIEADVVTLDTDTTVRFQRSGHVVTAAMSTDQWLVLQMPGFQRAYTRFNVNTAYGVEVWVEAEWQDGKPQTVTNVLMTKPLPGASFGTKAATSRMWESMVGLGSNTPFFVDLYRDFTGDRLQQDLVAGTETRTPIAWRFDGLDVVTTRTTGGGMFIERRWTPLGRTGKSMSLMEQELRTPVGGATFVYIPPRVIFYVDRGAAYPPAP